jgi:hypothetical protein
MVVLLAREARQVVHDHEVNLALVRPAVLQEVLELAAVRGLGAVAFFVEALEDFVALATAVLLAGTELGCWMTRSSAPTWNRRAVVRRSRMRAESRHRAARAGLSAVTVACAVDRRVHHASFRDMDAERLGVTPLSSDPVVETRSSKSLRARPPVVRIGFTRNRHVRSPPTSRWLRGRCCAPRAATRHAPRRTVLPAAQVRGLRLPSAARGTSRDGSGGGRTAVPFNRPSRTTASPSSVGACVDAAHGSGRELQRRHRAWAAPAESITRSRPHPGCRPVRRRRRYHS